MNEVPNKFKSILTRKGYIIAGSIAVGLGLLFWGCYAMKFNPFEWLAGAGSQPGEAARTTDVVPSFVKGLEPELERLAIFYGYPSLVKAVFYTDPSIIVDVKQDTIGAAKIFSNYPSIILGDGLRGTSHKDFEHTKKIMETLHAADESISVYGYVNLGCGYPKPTMEGVLEQLDSWKTNSYIDGVFYDCVTPEHLDDDLSIVKDAADAAHQRGLKVFMNAFKADWVAPYLSKGDSIMIEPMFLSEGNPYEYPYMDNLEKVIDKTDITIYGVATYDPNASFAAKQKQFDDVNKIGLEAGIDGLAFTTSQYGASGKESNTLLLFK